MSRVPRLHHEEAGDDKDGSGKDWTTGRRQQPRDEGACKKGEGIRRPNTGETSLPEAYVVAGCFDLIAIGVREDESGEKEKKWDR